MANTNPKRKRSADFTQREIDILQQLCLENKDLLDSAHKDDQTEKRKRLKWKEITDRVNAIHPSVLRTVDNIKKKWYNMRNDAKAKNAARNKLVRRPPTGGGSPVADLPTGTQVSFLVSFSKYK